MGPFRRPVLAGLDLLRIQTRSFARKSNFTSTKPKKQVEIELEMSDRDKEMLRRIKVVDDVNESRLVVEKLLRQGDPVAVDMEGIGNGGVTGLVQIRDQEGNFFFFRTAKNPDLYRSGRLGDLLESQYVL